MAHHILVVDDDQKIRSLLSDFLQHHNYIVSTASCIKECKKQIALFKFDLIVLDVMMPKTTGIEFLQQQSDKFSTPVILLTALGDIDDRINGLQSGAADYLAKPFDPKELVLRIKNIIDRSFDIVSKPTKCIFANYVFNLKQQTLFLDQQDISLTTNERLLLAILAENSGEIVPREEIQKKLNQEINLRTIDTQIARLRNKLESFS